MTIKEKIDEVRNKFPHDPKFADKVRSQAIAAIYAGIGSPEWRDFMLNFAAEGSAELARLTERKASDEDCSRYIAQARTYLVGNVLCTPNTFTTTKQGVDDILDQTLGEDPAPPEP